MFKLFNQAFLIKFLWNVPKKYLQTVFTVYTKINNFTVVMCVHINAFMLG